MTTVRRSPRHSPPNVRTATETFIRWGSITFGFFAVYGTGAAVGIWNIQ